jgi:spermidine synthase
VLVPAVQESGKLKFSSRSVSWAVVTVAFAAWMMSGVAQIPGLLVAYGRYMVTWIQSAGEIVFWDEGMNSSMAVSVMSDGTMNYHNAGKVQASSDPVDMRLQRMLGHLTTLLPPNPRNVLVIGCGAGVTAGAVSIDPAVERVTIAEIEPLVPEFVSRHFSEHNFAVIENPKVQVRIDDGRHYLLTTDEKFDAITSDPFDPWVKGAATLYTKEFFELVKRKLNPGGVITVFVQLYEAGEPAVKSEIATFLEVFPNGVVFGNTSNGQGYDVVLFAQVGENVQINLDAVEAKLRSPEYGQVAYSLSQIGFYSAQDLFSTFAGKGPELLPWLADAQINRDRNLRLQYLAGLGLNKYEQGSIYAGMLNYRQFPEGLFTGSPERIEALRQAIAWRQ